MDYEHIHFASLAAPSELDATDGPRRRPACRSLYVSYKELQITIFYLWSPRDPVYSK